MLHKFGLWLWRVVPFTRKMRYNFLWMLNQKFLVGVGAVIVDEQERVLLFNHSYRAKYPWGLPSGWLKKGESPAQAVVREVFEESKLTVHIIRPIETNTGTGRPNIHIIFLGKLSGEMNFIPSAEVTEARFFHIDELPKLIPEQVRLIQQYLVEQVTR